MYSKLNLDHCPRHSERKRLVRNPQNCPLIQRIFRKATTLAPDQSRRLQRQNAPKMRGRPPPIKTLTKNLDIALLDRENAVPTHVKPFIASFTCGIVAEELVVVGACLLLENKVLKESQRGR
ncbi:hypothetical protein H0H92_003344 [Tricholoma furcatifolium]|nr:hypothetical protein H0H92_003344 [Tricholoma furcatifolium]